MRRFDGAPIIQPILFKSAVYWLCVFIVRLLERPVHFLIAGWTSAGFPAHLIIDFSWAVTGDEPRGVVSGAPIALFLHQEQTDDGLRSGREHPLLGQIELVGERYTLERISQRCRFGLYPDHRVFSHTVNGVIHGVLPRKKVAASAMPSFRPGQRRSLLCDAQTPDSVFLYKSGH